MKQPDTAYRRFYLVQIIYYAVNVCGMTYLVPILQDKGFDNIAIGLAMTLYALTSAVLQPLYGFLCDKYNAGKSILITALLLTTLSHFLLLRVEGTLSVNLLTCLLGATFFSMPGVIDSWGYKLINKGYPINYGVSRGIGSGMYAVANFATGLLYVRFGQPMLAVALLLLTILMFLVTRTLPYPKFVESAKEKLSVRDTAAVLLKNHDYLILVICFMLAFISHMGLNTYYAVLIAELGGTPSHVAYGFATRGMTEMLVMVIFSRLCSRFQLNHIILFSLFFMAVKSIAVSQAPNLFCAVAFMLLQGLSFSLLLPGALAFVSERVEGKYLSTALLLLNALGFAMGQVIGNMISGVLAEWYSVRFAILATSSTSLIACFIFGIYLFRRRFAKATVDKTRGNRYIHS